MFETLKKLFSGKQNSKVNETKPALTQDEPKKPKPSRKRREAAATETKPPEQPPKLTDKEIATNNGQPYVSIIKVEVDPENINSGSFELDWNDLWVAKLIRAGYRIKETDTDNDIVDRWFTDVCRNVVREIYEQEQADPQKREVVYREQRIVGEKNLGDGRREIS